MLGLKHSAVQDDQEIVQKMPLGTEKMKRIENKLTLVKINFFMKNYKALLKKCTEIKCNGPRLISFCSKIWSTTRSKRIPYDLYATIIFIIF